MISARNARGFTALHTAAVQGNLEVVDALLRLGAGADSSRM